MATVRKIRIKAAAKPTVHIRAANAAARVTGKTNKMPGIKRKGRLKRRLERAAINIQANAKARVKVRRPVAMTPLAGEGMVRVPAPDLISIRGNGGPGIQAPGLTTVAFRQRAAITQAAMRRVRMVRPVAVSATRVNLSSTATKTLLVRAPPVPEPAVNRARIRTMPTVAVSMLALTIKAKDGKRDLISRPVMGTRRARTPATRRREKGLEPVGGKGGELIGKDRPAARKLRAARDSKLSRVHQGKVALAATRAPDT